MARNTTEAVVSCAVGITNAGDAGVECGGVVGGSDGHIQGLSRAGSAIADSHGESFACVGLERLDGCIVGYVDIGAAAAVQV